LMDDGRPRPKMMPFANPLAALFIPIFVCFVRAGFVRKPSECVSKLRSVLYQVLIAFALISLLVFEIGVGLFVGAPGIPLNAWLIVAGLGVIYVTFLCLADMTNSAPKSELVPNPYSVDNLKQDQDRRTQRCTPVAESAGFTIENLMPRLGDRGRYPTEANVEPNFTSRFKCVDHRVGQRV
jgi:hypothetical protein